MNTTTNVAKKVGPTFNEKVIYSAVSALFFILVSLPDTYRRTNKIATTINGNCPTPIGKFIHTAVFFILNFVMMKISSSYKGDGQQLDNALIAKYSFYGALMFFLISSSDTYKLTGSLLGLGSQDGCPNLGGIIVHGLVFATALVLIMYFPKDNK